MKASKTKDQFQTRFQQPKSGLQRNDINIPDLVRIEIISKDTRDQRSKIDASINN